MASPRCLHCLRPASWLCLECREDVCREDYCTREHLKSHEERDPDKDLEDEDLRTWEPGE